MVGLRMDTEARLGRGAAACGAVGRAAAGAQCEMLVAGWRRSCCWVLCCMFLLLDCGTELLFRLGAPSCRRVAL